MKTAWILCRASRTALSALAIEGEESLGSVGFVQSRCRLSVGADENTLVGLDGFEQRTLYSRPRSICKECVNYKQQGLSTIWSALNDVILTLKLPKTHFMWDCLLCYIEVSPVL